MSPSNTTRHQVNKSHKVESRNQKSLHQKQLKHSECDSKPNSTGVDSNNKPALVTGDLKSGQSSTSQSDSSASSSSNQLINHDHNLRICNNLEDFSKIAQQLKAGIRHSLNNQISHQTIDQPTEVIELKKEILQLAGETETSHHSEAHLKQPPCETTDIVEKESKLPRFDNSQQENESSTCASNQAQTENQSSQTDISSTNSQKEVLPASSRDETKSDTIIDKCRSCHVPCGSSNAKGLIQMSSRKKPADNEKNEESEIDKILKVTLSALYMDGWSVDVKNDTIVTNLLNSCDDHTLLIKALCHRMVIMNEQKKQSMISLENELDRSSKLEKANKKLKELCRELQKSNNTIRIESLDLIKIEQTKAKEQTAKIQSTLSGVIKLFDENQQRNINLRQENQELQVKLKSLLDHCDSWEKSVETALRQREIENRLLKTELAKANLIKNEEKEKFLNEKRELLQILSLMQEQQQRIQGQEAKLRSDLSSYATKYDECQAVISKGMDKFQIESKRMLKEMDKSKQDYKVLLKKYESTNRKMSQLLEEKQYWNKAMNTANKKVETLERLCRALREQNPDNNLLINHKSSSIRGSTTTKLQDRKKPKQKEAKSPINVEKQKSSDVTQCCSPQENFIVEEDTMTPESKVTPVNLSVNETSLD